MLARILTSAAISLTLVECLSLERFDMKNYDSEKPSIDEYTTGIRSKLNDSLVFEHGGTSKICNLITIIPNRSSSQVKGLKLRNTNTCPEVWDALEDFQNYLKGYRYRTYFDAAGFEANLAKVEKRRSDLATLVAESAISSLEFASRVTFTDYMYNVMVVSSACINHYTTPDPRHDMLVHVITEFNLLCFTLLDSRGKPNPKVRGYWWETERLSRLLEAWKKSADGVGHIPGPVRKLMDTQYKQAHSTLESLKNVIW